MLTEVYEAMPSISRDSSLTLEDNAKKYWPKYRQLLDSFKS